MIKNTDNAKSSVELFNEFKSAVNVEYKENNDNFMTLNDNFNEIDKRKLDNEEVILRILNDFESKLSDFKSQGQSKQDAINNTFMVLNSNYENEELNTKTVKAFNVFKTYYTSKLFIPKSSISIDNMLLGAKLLKTVPFKEINLAFSGKSDIKALEAFNVNVNKVLQFAKKASESDLVALQSDLNSYFVLKNNKMSIDKSNFKECYLFNFESVLKVIGNATFNGLSYIGAKKY